MRYWRDKQKREIDFVLLRRGKPPLAIETQPKAGQADHRNLLAFRASYPDAELALVAGDIDRAYNRTVKEVQVRYLSLSALIRWLGDSSRS